MIELATLIITLSAGILLGLLFFGGLWWTIKKSMASQRPALWFLGSFMIRIGLTITGFYLISHDHWERAVVCLAGFILARAITLRITRTPSASTSHLTKKTCHEN